MISQQRPSNGYDQQPPLFASPQANQEKSQASWATLQASHCLFLQYQQELCAGNALLEYTYKRKKNYVLQAKQTLVHIIKLRKHGSD
jgi:hypothetical protein